ncbi:hypothetical protein EKD04_014560 [Chloroflexales bacterium ZM16-3]|nr:hypothetical protein [Chloroflexales bacterium ZM16-3]
MEMRPLDEAIAAALREVGELEERDRAGRAHADVQARMGYLHDLLRRLERELAGLRQEAAGIPQGEDLWRQTVDDLRASEPDFLLAPAPALISGDLDLLRLVEYTAGSVALVQERRSVLRQTRPPEPAE